MKCSLIAVSAGMLALILSPGIHAQEVSLTQMPGRPLPQVIINLVPTTVELLYKDPNGTMPISEVYTDANGEHKGTLVGDDPIKGIIVKWRFDVRLPEGTFGAHNQGGSFVVRGGKPLYNNTVNFSYSVERPTLGHPVRPNRRVLIGTWEGDAPAFMGFSEIECLGDGSAVIEHNFGGSYSVIENSDRWKVQVGPQAYIFNHVRVWPREKITLQNPIPILRGQVVTLYFEANQ